MSLQEVYRPYAVEVEKEAHAPATPQEAENAPKGEIAPFRNFAIYKKDVQRKIYIRLEESPSTESPCQSSAPRASDMREGGHQRADSRQTQVPGAARSPDVPVRLYSAPADEA